MNKDLVDATQKYNYKRIIAYQGDRSACGFYRLLAPLHNMTDQNRSNDYKFYVTGELREDQIGKFDIAVFQRQYKPEVLYAMKSMKKKGMKLVYEVDDDLFNVPKWNPTHKWFNRSEVRSGIEECLRMCDAIFVTNDYLKSVYEKHNENVYVLPNSIDFELVFKPPRNSKKKVVCWQGSNTHEKDLNLIKPCIKKLVKDDDTFVKMWSLKLPGTHTVPLIPFEGFWPMLSQLDVHIGLAPITPTAFNKSKSNLKFLEYSSLGIPTVASNYGEYKNTIVDGETGLLVDTVGQWYDAVRSLLDDEALYNRISKNAKKFVFENYNIATNCKLWKSAFDEITGENS